LAAPRAWSNGRDGKSEWSIAVVQQISWQGVPAFTIGHSTRTQMVQLEMEVAGMSPFGCNLKNPNFAALAKAVGLFGVRVEDPTEVRPALKQALAHNGPALVDVVTDPNALAMPPRATIQQAAGFALAMTKMAFAGEIGDVLDTVAANWRELV